MSNKKEIHSAELLINPQSLIDDYKMGQEITNIQGRVVAILGGGNVENKSTYYKEAQIFANSIASKNISIITGGGSGIMEAANYGASLADPNKMLSYGIRVKAIIDEMAIASPSQKIYEFETLSLRLLTLISACDVAVFFPGGFGTLEELFSLLVRIKVNMVKKIPIYLFGSTFWTPLRQWMDSCLVEENVITEVDTRLFTIIDDLEMLSRQIVLCIGAIDD
jgi:uncharacterized protein (TIGR00730 family)